MYDGEDTYQEYQDDPSYQDDQEYQDDPAYSEYQAPDPAPEASGPEIISTSQAVNLTSTLAALSALAGLFLCFADQRSRAIRRYSIQSVGLGVVHIGTGLICLLLSALLGWIPLLGYLFYLLMWVVFLAISVVIVLLRLRMMLHAYRGEAYVLPVLGETLRRFE